MNFRDYLIIMALGTGLSLAAWLIILFSINPSEAGWLGIVFFHLTLFVSAVGVLATFGAIMRVLLQRDAVISRQVAVSFRHAILFAVLIDSTLILLANGYMRWWLMLILVVMVTGIELFFLSFRTSRASPA